MTTRSFLVWFSMCALSFIGTVGPVAAADQEDQRRFQSRRNGYSITVPEGWAPIPAHQARNLRAAMPSAPGFDVDAGFYYAASGRGFSYPYALMQVTCYVEGREPTDREMRQLVKVRAGQHPDTIRADFSSTTKSFTWEYRLDVPQLGRLHVLTVGYFGRKRLVEVTCYSMDSEFAGFKPVFRQMQKSFEFNAGMEHSRQKKGNKLIVPLCIGLGVLVLLAIVNRLR